MAINMGKKQVGKNLALNILAFGVQFFISFFITPILVGKVGTEAYGFIGLANDFVNYAAIITSIFNSVAARFIANAFYRKEYDEANSYFNSLIIANFILAGILAMVGVVFIPGLEHFLSVPAHLVLDVKLTFAMVFLSYIVTLLTMVFTTSLFVTNRTDIQWACSIISYIIRLAAIVVFLLCLPIRIYWIAAAALIASVVVAVMNVGFTKLLTPELHLDFKMVHASYVKVLAQSGCWMAFTSISNILIRGLDLTVANVMIGSYEMGLLSIARTMPNQITSVIATMAPIFTPVFVAHYAAENQNGLKTSIQDSIYTMALVLFVPISGFIIYSGDFYRLWQPSLSVEELKIVTALSTITAFQAYFNSSTATMAQVSVVTNKLKLPVFVSFFAGVLNVATVVLLVKFTNWGVYAIVFSSTLVMTLRYVLFNSIYAARIIGVPAGTFYPAVFKTWCMIPVLCGAMYFIKEILPVCSWVGLIRNALISAIVGYLLMALLFARNKIKKMIDKRV